jgi:hypothetical protein
MVRITTEEHGNSVVLRVEGSLRGPWVAELEKVWHGKRGSGRQLLLKLEGVSYVDDDAKALLTRMLQDGMDVTANDLYMTGILREMESASEV